MKKEEKTQNNSNQLNSVVKVFLYMAGFNVLVRTDLWISVSAVILIGIYLLQMGFFNKALSSLNQSWFKSMANKGQLFSLRCFEQNAVGKDLEKEQSSKQLEQPVHQENLPDTEEFFCELPDGFFENEGSFDDIWQDDSENNCSDE